jgi:hypothetical protein
MWRSDVRVPAGTAQEQRHDQSNERGTKGARTDAVAWFSSTGDAIRSNKLGELWQADETQIRGSTSNGELLMTIWGR